MRYRNKPSTGAGGDSAAKKLVSVVGVCAGGIFALSTSDRRRTGKCLAASYAVPQQKSRNGLLQSGTPQQIRMYRLAQPWLPKGLTLQSSQMIYRWHQLGHGVKAIEQDNHVIGPVIGKPTVLMHPTVLGSISCGGAHM